MSMERLYTVPESVVIVAYETLLSELSEDYWCAGWLCDICHVGYDIAMWENPAATEDGEDPYDHDKYGPRLRALIDSTGMWMSERGKLMPVEEWKVVHKAWRKKRSTPSGGGGRGRA